MRSSDFDHLKGDDRVALGKVAISRLTNTTPNKHDTEALTDEIATSLSDADIQALVPALMSVNQWAPTADGEPTLVDLGAAVQSAKEREDERHRKFLEQFKSIGQNYAFLEPSALTKLQDQMARLSAVPRLAPDTTALQSFLRQSNAFDGLKDQIERLRGLSSNKTLDDLARSSRTVDALIKGTSSSIADAMRGLDEEVLTPRTLPLPHIPRPEETPVGRATIESAVSLSTAAARLDALVSIIGGLNQTLVTEVLPSWFKQVEHEQRNAQESFGSAARNLRWAQWAIVASALVTIAATWWQVTVAREIDRDNSAQLKLTEALLQQQLSVQREALEHQRQEASRLQEVIEAQRRESQELRAALGRAGPKKNKANPRR